MLMDSLEETKQILERMIARNAKISAGNARISAILDALIEEEERQSQPQIIAPDAEDYTTKAITAQMQ